VKRNVAAAIALGYLDPAGGKYFGGSQHIGSFGVTSEGDDGCVFKQQEHIADLFCFAQVDQLSLQAQTFGVVKCAELDNGNHG
jgi:hypothetical protein